MATLKKQNTGFTQVSNKVLNDKKLSFREKGIYAYLYSKPNGWEFSGDRMAEQTKEGRKAIYASLKALEKAGYISRKRLKTGKMQYTLMTKMGNRQSKTPMPQKGSSPTAQNGHQPYCPKRQSAKRGSTSNKDSNSNKELYADKSPHKQFIKFFYDVSKKTRGVKPIITGKDGKNLKRVLEMNILTTDELEKIALYYLGANRFRSFGPTISIFLSAGILNSLMNAARNDPEFYKELEVLSGKYLGRSPKQNGRDLAVKIAALKNKFKC